MFSRLWHTPLADARRHCYGSAFCGVVALLLYWLTFLRQSPLEEWLLVLGPLVIVPLGLALLAPDSSQRLLRGMWLSAVWLQLPAALLFIGSFLSDPGHPSPLLATPWLLFTVLMALFGLARLLRGGFWPPEELAINVGLIYLAVGGGWAWLSRLGPGWEIVARWGVPSLGFSDLIVLLTAVHFHYAGFALLLLTGLAGHVLQNRIARLTAVGVIVAVPLVAVGITLSQVQFRSVEPWAAWLMAAAASLAAVLHLWLALRTRRLLPRLLFAVAGASLLAGMALAAVYAWGRYTGLPWIDIPQMIPYHGAVNALGFALPALLAWNLLLPATEKQAAPVPR
jgi:YndJ-like protein